MLSSKTAATPTASGRGRRRAASRTERLKSPGGRSVPAKTSKERGASGPAPERALAVHGRRASEPRENGTFLREYDELAEIDDEFEPRASAAADCSRR